LGINKKWRGETREIKIIAEISNLNLAGAGYVGLTIIREPCRRFAYIHTSNLKADKVTANM
jgi:hypothetical protein